VNDFNDLLARRDAFQNLLPHRTDTHIFDEVLDHLEIHIRFKQGHPDFAQRPLNVIFIKTAATSQFLENSVQFFCQAFKHGCFPDPLIPRSLHRTDNTIQSLVFPGHGFNRLLRFRTAGKCPHYDTEPFSFIRQFYHFRPRRITHR
jgi:hypothetical protein